jgi:hypothetical protein
MDRHDRPPSRPSIDEIAGESETYQNLDRARRMPDRIEYGVSEGDRLDARYLVDETGREYEERYHVDRDRTDAAGREPERVHRDRRARTDAASRRPESSSREKELQSDPSFESSTWTRTAIPDRDRAPRSLGGGLATRVFRPSSPTAATASERRQEGAQAEHVERPAGDSDERRRESSVNYHISVFSTKATAPNLLKFMSTIHVASTRGQYSRPLYF